MTALLLTEERNSAVKCWIIFDTC